MLVVSFMANLLTLGFPWLKKGSNKKKGKYIVWYVLLFILSIIPAWRQSSYWAALDYQIGFYVWLASHLMGVLAYQNSMTDEAPSRGRRVRSKLPF